MSLILRRNILLAGSGGGTPTPPTPSILPDGYTQLSYIEQLRGNSGYINTGIIASNTIGFEIDAISYDTVSGNANLYGCFFGGRQKTGTNDFQLTTYSSNTSSYEGTLRVGATNNYSAGLVDNTRFSARLSGSTYTINGTDTTVVRNIVSGKEIYLFALNNNGTAAQFGHFRLYSFVITDSGSEARHFYPCKNPNNVIGLYDTIGDTFYTSENSTAFIGG